MLPPQSLSSTSPTGASNALANQISALGDWFHNIDLRGIQTAPNHFLGDFPNVKWRHISPALPLDLNGATVLDIGCNAGFYSLQMKMRGAGRVLGIDICDRYLDQARLASRTLGLEIELEKRSVYEVEEIAGQFDFVIFMGVLYHLRYPLYALDKVVTKVGGKTGLPDHDSRLRRCKALGERLRFLAQRYVCRPLLAADVLCRAELLERSDELVDSQPVRRRSHVALRRS